MTLGADWADADRVGRYLADARRGGVEGEHRQPHRAEAEDVLLSLLPERVDYALDLGCGDGRLLEVVLSARPGADGVGLDGSAVMVEAARERLSVGDANVRTIVHDLSCPLWEAGFERSSFDVVVSAFAIHHCEDDRKKDLFAEIFAILRPNGLFALLDSIEPPEDVEMRWLVKRMPSDRLSAVDAQLSWMRAAGMTQVDCYWKWLDIALMVGMKP